MSFSSRSSSKFSSIPFTSILLCILRQGMSWILHKLTTTASSQYKSNKVRPAEILGDIKLCVFLTFTPTIYIEVPTYTVRYTPYNVHYVHIMQFTLHNIHCTIYTAKYTLHNIHCTIYTMQCKGYSLLSWELL